MKEGLLSGVTCPVSTQDISINLKNRNHAFKEYGYGPPNPNETNDAFWLKKAKMYNAPTDSIKGMLCGKFWHFKWGKKTLLQMGNFRISNGKMKKTL